MQRRCLALVCCVVAGMALAGPAAAEQISEQLSVEYASQRFDDRFEVYDPRFVERGLLLFNLKIRNVSGESRSVEYRVDWYDEDRLSMPTVTGWQSLRLGPNQEADIRAASQQPGAASARLTLREP